MDEGGEYISISPPFFVYKIYNKRAGAFKHPLFF